MSEAQMGLEAVLMAIQNDDPKFTELKSTSLSFGDFELGGERRRY